MTLLGYLMQAIPKVIFDADASLATSKFNRTLADQRFHGYVPPPLVTYDGLAASLWPQ
jgi:hypothetical protein